MKIDKTLLEYSSQEQQFKEYLLFINNLILYNVGNYTYIGKNTYIFFNIPIIHINYNYGHNPFKFIVNISDRKLAEEIALKYEEIYKGTEITIVLIDGLIEHGRWY